MMWSFVACGNVDPAAQDELASGLGEFLSDPRFGTGHSSLVIGPGSPAPVHIPGERACEPAAA